MVRYIKGTTSRGRKLTEQLGTLRDIEFLKYTKVTHREALTLKFTGERHIHRKEKTLIDSQTVKGRWDKFGRTFEQITN